jgi:GT2 family glycosyltransferase/exo-beta-1,3-glucanase (GH17 family)
LERSSLQSIASLTYAGKIFLVIHDDSVDAEANAEVDEAASELMAQHPHLDIRVLRRPEKEGGKAGAVNYALEHTAYLYEYFILCDNDSTILDPDLVQRSLPYFDNEGTAILQYRSVGFDSPGYCRVNRMLRKCIDAFHVLMTVLSRYGWQPFIGHNAMLRTAPVLEVGGFTPGFFSDDLDMTIRLNLRGYKVAYAGNLPMAENHPPSYASFRKRTYKWAYGCMQSVKAHGWNVLSSGRLSLAEKFFFLIFTGFYFMQILLLLYMTLTFLLGPFFLDVNPLGVVESLFAGSVIVFIIYLPFLAYFLKEGKLKEALGPLLVGALVYGTSDFLCTRGTVDCLLNRKRKWIPTNQVMKKKNNLSILLEPLFGLSLLMVPLIYSPSIFFLPCAYLWAGKFLFVPGLQHVYQDREPVAEPRPKARVAQLAGLVVLFLFASLFSSTQAYAGDENQVEVRGKEIYVGGESYYVKGVHYSPWRPGTGPNKGYKYPSPEEVEADLELIGQANANTILVYDAPGYVLDIAQKHNLKVLYTFAVNWWAAEAGKPVENKEAMLNRVKELKSKPALLAWVLGNEIPEAALIQKGNEPFEHGLRDLYSSVKGIDAAHPVTHSNWPPAKTLQLGFLDFISFNVYPVWPPEVVTRGYGNYIREVLQPIAGEKPLLVTEFGVNSLEAGEEGQARIVGECWAEILKSGTAGGIVFAFADEWWKNYDNPQRPGNYWFRAGAPEDEARHDEDPEEHYGIMTAGRIPKPAYHAVQEMFREQDALYSRLIPATVMALLILSAIALWYKGSRKKKEEQLQIHS